MSGRSTLFPHHPDHGTKPSLLETGTFFERGEIESSPFVAAMEALSKNASLVQAAVAGNATAQELFDPFQMYCAVSGGTNCAAIGRERCTCYCVEPGTCTQVMAAKYAKAAVALLEMALDIASAVATGGTATAAKAAAKSVAKTALKNVAEKAAKTAARGAIRKAAVNAAKHFVKTASVKAMARLSKKATKELMQEWAKTALKAGMKHYLKTKVADAIKDAIWKLGCESVMNSIFDEAVTVPDWINNPSYKWGSGNGPEGFLEIADITGVVGLVGIFHEADCPTPIPGVTGDSCPR
jgi:hypothetical protein